MNELRLLSGSHDGLLDPIREYSSNSAPPLGACCQVDDWPDDDTMKISVIISTYNKPDDLEKTLCGYQAQSYQDFEILVADDGSGDETREVIARAAHRASFPIRHVWHEDDGFRKSEILNKAICLSAGNYLIFSDGDCIPRNDFVLSHRRYARENFFLAGGSHIDVPSDLHQKFSNELIQDQQVFDPDWLESHGVPLGRKRMRLTRNQPLASLFDLFTPRSGVLIGCNSSAWKQDIVRINGFDTSWSYGGEDQELGIRLSNFGIRSRRMKHSLVCIHLDHKRPYRDKEQVRLNKRKLQETRQHRVTWIASGLDQHNPSIAQFERSVLPIDRTDKDTRRDVA